MGRIIIGFKNPHGFYNDFNITRYTHLDDLFRDYERYSLVMSDKDKFNFSEISVYAIGSINDETGYIETYNFPELVINFPKFVHITEVEDEVKK